MIAQLDPFHAIAVSTLAHRLASQGQDIIHMEFGQPSTGAPAKAIAAAHEVLDTDPMGYWESQALKARIARHYLETAGVTVDPSRIVLTCGASPALVMALSLIGGPGARVAFARPGYVAYRNNARALFMEPVEVPCGDASGTRSMRLRWRLSSPRPMRSSSPVPPTPPGRSFPPTNWRGSRKCAENAASASFPTRSIRASPFSGDAPSILDSAPDALVVNSFSKYFSMPGWRLGWLVTPEDLADAARARMGNLFLTPPVISQKAGLVAFDCREELEGYVATYARNRDLLLAALPDLGLKRIAPPDGAFYIYADVGHLTQDSMAFALRLLEDTGVAIAPGIDFDPVEGNRFIRFSFAVSTPLVEEAIRRLKPWFAAQPLLETSETV
jgi:aspartate/methionine/tyrosine aminotransferase